MTQEPKKRGVLLVNLGSPESPSTGDVRRFLRQFLMDERVLDAPYPIRFGIVHFAILPFRPKKSAEAYEKIWTLQGSPLIVISKNVQRTLAARLDIPVGLAMRYQRPSIEEAIANLRDQSVDNLLVIPLFPHYAMSSFETAVERVKIIASRLAPGMALSIQRPYHDHPHYLKALTANAAEFLVSDYDHLLFSFHGIPERHIRKADPTGCHCLSTPDCCQSPTHNQCYRAQCFATARAFVKATAIPANKYSISFQSRLGREPWLSPYTDKELVRLAQLGVKKLLVMCPAFVSDCLETLEEIGLRGRDTFRQAGGQKLTLIPCLNEHPLWIAALEQMIAEWRS